MPKPLPWLVVIRDGQPWILKPWFSRSAAYRRHRRSLEGIARYVEMLGYLEELVVRLRRVARIDRTAARTNEQWIQRSAEKTQAFFEHTSVAHDLRRGVGFAVRFVNTTALYWHGRPEEQALARRASRTIGELLFPPMARPRGPQRLPPVSLDVQALRSSLRHDVRGLWKTYDQSERRAALLKLITQRGWTIASSAVPVTIGMRPPTRVADLLLQQHTGIGQKRLRRAGVSAIDTFIYQ